MTAFRRYREKLYEYLVRRHSGIEERYMEKRKQDATAAGRAKAWARLLWWNARVHLPGGRTLRQRSGLFRDGESFGQQTAIFEGYGYGRAARFGKRKGRDRRRFQESADQKCPPPETLLKRLRKYDVVSFDIFDTLLLRPFAKPEDVFYFVGMELAYPDFKELRIQAEQKARRTNRGQGGTGEITLREIWEELSEETGIPAGLGMQTELAAERRYCFANPYFVPVLEQLRREEKTLLAVSDMYLPTSFIKELLREKGLGVFDGYYISGDMGKSKALGDIYGYIEQELSALSGKEKNKGIIHIGDNRYSDVRMAKEAGWEAVWYPNPQEAGEPYRARDMSAITGSMYRGMVNNRLHIGGRAYSGFYEYGYVCGGLLALGYCQFIRRYAREHAIGKIWFLARDGELLKKIYDVLYPGEDTAYVLWSRNVSARLSSDYYRHDYFQRFLYQKTGQGYRMKEIFDSMRLKKLLPDFCRAAKISPETELSMALANRCRSYLQKRWRQVQKIYEPELKIAREYITEMTKDGGNIAAVDIGWAGSGAVSLRYLTEQRFRLPCTIYALLAGSNSCHNPMPDTSEGFFLEGRMESYLFSQTHNRDIWKFHNLLRRHNLYAELLFTSVRPTLKGFERGADGEVSFCFGREEACGKEIRQIQKGIWDFIGDYRKYFGGLLKEGRGGISGRDAYAPLSIFLSDEEWQKQMERAFSWDVSPNVE